MTRISNRALLVCLLLLGCGSGAAPAGNSTDLPNKSLGPFRPFKTGETGVTAPAVINRTEYRAPTILPLGDGTVGQDLAVYAQSQPVSNLPAIFRYVLVGGRDQRDQTEVSLVASEPWEMTTGLGDPSVLKVGNTSLLFYTSGGCIGAAVGDAQGENWQKLAQNPLLCPQPQARPWEGQRLHGPGAARLSDGLVHVFYGGESGIGEAIWNESAMTLEPTNQVVFSAQGSGFYGQAVKDPAPLVGIGPGDGHDYLYFTGVAPSGVTAIGLAARESSGGVFVANDVPVLTRFLPSEPCAIGYGELTYLVTGGDNREAGNISRTVIGAVAPADRRELPELPPDPSE